MIDFPPDCQSALQSPVMQRIYQVESGFNPFAIGVVGGRLVRQPKNLDEAVATAKYLVSLGRNFSIGQGQVNRIHFSRLGWDVNIQAGFDVCKNAVAAHHIFQECYSRAISSGFSAKQEYNATAAALSCYYSGKLYAGKTNQDVRRYINNVLSISKNRTASADNISFDVPLARQNLVPRSTAKNHVASMLLHGNFAVSNATSMMLTYKEKN
jgi:type IV secretion system protein VirB1